MRLVIISTGRAQSRTSGEWYATTTAGAAAAATSAAAAALRLAAACISPPVLLACRGVTSLAVGCGDRAVANDAWLRAAKAVSARTLAAAYDSAWASSRRVTSLSVPRTTATCSAVASARLA
eukprot:TRINITY_DN5778_c0_g2_i1.p5 TRINITY_DN5778_c0_g2~~TRINITY_DN5778_c0_g2_i1.p5  ORF type:complete len:122 (-),score=17.97 TRINITY_DN5778_c0_g2_i1:1029-1394(-)